jgi:hypothetical protein
MALVRKLATVAYLMLKHNEPYRYARPELMAKKVIEPRSRYLPTEQRSQHTRLRASDSSQIVVSSSTDGQSASFRHCPKQRPDFRDDHRSHR